MNGLRASGASTLGSACAAASSPTLLADESSLSGRRAAKASTSPSRISCCVLVGLRARESVGPADDELAARGANPPHGGRLSGSPWCSADMHGNQGDIAAVLRLLAELPRPPAQRTFEHSVPVCERAGTFATTPTRGDEAAPLIPRPSGPRLRVGFHSAHVPRLPRVRRKGSAGRLRNVSLGNVRPAGGHAYVYLAGTAAASPGHG